MFLTKNDLLKEVDGSEKKSVTGFSPLGGEIYRTPRFDMKEHQGKYVVCMEIPGSKKDAIETKIENYRLLVNAKVLAEKDDNTTKYFHRERHISSYKHDVILPKDADTQSLKNEYRNGLLIVTIDKKKP